MSVGDLSDMESEWDPCETPGQGCAPWAGALAIVRATSNNGRTTPLNRFWTARRVARGVPGGTTD